VVESDHSLISFRLAEILKHWLEIKNQIAATPVRDGIYKINASRYGHRSRTNIRIAITLNDSFIRLGRMIRQPAASDRLALWL
jgi:hypothetical protein